MDMLLKIGVAGATPFVVQFLMDYFTNGNASQITLRKKMQLSIATGGVLAILLQLYVMSLPAPEIDNGMTVLIPNFLGWFFIALNGCISGAMATGAVALGFKVAEKVSAGPSETEVRVTGSND